jgi:hypothetical protein
VKFIEVDAWVESEVEAKAELGQPLSSDHPDMLCVSVSREEDPPIVQALPPKRDHPANPKLPQIQDPAPDPLPGKVRWRLHYKVNE